MTSQDSATSDMEKRIELEKRGRAAEEVSEVQVRWAGLVDLIQRISYVTLGDRRPLSNTNIKK